MSTPAHVGALPASIAALPNSRCERTKSVLTLFGTRPEAIKLAPVIHQLERQGFLRTINVSSGQHSDLLYPLVELFRIRVDRDLRMMTHNQDPAILCRRLCIAIHKIIDSDVPDIILVQGDTTTALAGALVGHQRGIAVAHVEAGLRSGNILSPYPEEMNRRLITRLATYHFASTKKNRDTLLQEGIPENAVFVTGNPVVDALKMVIKMNLPFSRANLLSQMENHKCILLTTHRRESFGRTLADNLRALSQFVLQRPDVMLVFPAHPNPNVSGPAKQILADNPRAVVVPPLPYADFIRILSKSWLIVSDSGGIQEEVPSLGKPLLILRQNTERPECIEAGMARLVGGSPEALTVMLEEAHEENSWANSVHTVPNPFGEGDSAKRIVRCLAGLMGENRAERCAN